MSFQTFEPGDTRQFTWVSSLAPDAAPILKIYSTVDDATVIASMTAQSSDSTHYWTLFTMPASQGQLWAPSSATRQATISSLG